MSMEMFSRSILEESWWHCTLRLLSWEMGNDNEGEIEEENTSEVTDGDILDCSIKQPEKLRNTLQGLGWVQLGNNWWVPDPDNPLRQVVQYQK